MAKKDSRFLAILSTIVLFAIIATLYIVPSIITLKGNFSEEIEIIETPAPITVIFETPVIETKPELHVNRTIEVNGNDAIINAYDGYGYIQIPSSVSPEHVENAIIAIREQIPTVVIELRYKLENNTLNLTYNQGYSESEINTLIDTVETILTTKKTSVVPGKPNLYVFDRTVQERPFDISKTIKVGNSTIAINAKNEYATLEYPSTYILQSDVADALVALYSAFEGFDLDLDAALQDGKTELFYSELYSKEDIEYALFCIESYANTLCPPLESIVVPETPTITVEEAPTPEIQKEPSADIVEEPTQEAIVIKIPSRPQIGIASQFINVEPPVEHEHRAINVDNTTLVVDAYNGYATISTPKGISDEEIATIITELYEQYGTYMGDIDFAIDKDYVEVLYSTGYTKEEINVLLDALENYIKSIKIEEPAPVEDVETKEEPAVPTAPFDIKVYVVENKESEVKVPAKPEFIVSHISRNIDALGSTIKVDAYDGHATFTLSGAFSEDMIATAIADMYSFYKEEMNDFEFAIDGNVVEALYSTNYTEREINEFIDAVEYYLSLIETPKEKEIRIPRKPTIAVSSQSVIETQDIVHCHKTLVIDNTPIEVNAYDGYATFDFDFNLDQESVATMIADLYSTFGSVMDDFDFGIDKTSINASYSEGYSTKELEAFIDSIEAYFAR